MDVNILKNHGRFFASTDRTLLGIKPPAERANPKLMQGWYRLHMKHLYNISEKKLSLLHLTPS